MGTGFKLFFNIRIPHNRPCNKLGEHCDVRSEAYGVALRGKAAVYIGGIAYKLEGIEAYSHRKRKPQQRQRKPGSGIKITDKEIRIFEIKQKPQADRN